MASETPDISIITATYNRSNILKYTIESVRAQKCRHTWEHWVIGDACTDDTEAVVSAFKDPRIKFHNLPVNIGEQSGPNNEGFARSRGRFISYVNHDDLWFSDHLSLALETLESEPVDGVYTMGLVLAPDGTVSVTGASSTGMYHPNLFVPASLWVFRREVLESLGGWRACREIFIVPSQDVLTRAWKAGLRLQMVPAVTVVLIQSGSRKNSYSDRQEAEHAEAAMRMNMDSGYRESLLLAALYSAASNEMDMSLWPHGRRLIRNVLTRLCLKFGITLRELRCAAKYRRKGGFIQHLRSIRGLPPMPKNPVEPAI